MVYSGWQPSMCFYQVMNTTVILYHHLTWISLIRKNLQVTKPRNSAPYWKQAWLAFSESSMQPLLAGITKLWHHCYENPNAWNGCREEREELSGNHKTEAASDGEATADKRIQQWWLFWNFKGNMSAFPALFLIPKLIPFAASQIKYFLLMPRFLLWFEICNVRDFFLWADYLLMGSAMRGGKVTLLMSRPIRTWGRRAMQDAT